MEIKNYLRIIQRRIWVVLITTLVTLLIVAIGTYRATPIYEASTTFRIAAAAGGSVDYAVLVYADRLMNTYMEITTSGPVLEELKNRLGLSQLPEITAETIPNTELIKITVEGNDPTLVTMVSNTLAEIIVEQSNQLYAGSGKSQQEILGDQLVQIQADLDQLRQEYESLVAQTPPDAEKIEAARNSLEIKQNTYTTILKQYDEARIREEMRASMLSVIEPAVVPEKPSKPRVALNIILGLFIGLVGGIGLAFIFENLDTTLYTTEDIEELTQLNTLAKIPKASKKQLNISLDGTSQYTEAFRNLRLNIQLINPQHPIKVLLITSAEPGEGKSTIVANLAFVLAKSGKKVVVVDSDLRLPRINKIFGLTNKFGLSSVLERKVTLEDALQRSKFKEVTVLSSGPTPLDPPNLLNSPEMTNIVNKLNQMFEYVLIDAPAYLEVADVNALAQKVEGLILVVRRAHSRREAVQSAIKQMDGFKDKIVGIVVNQAEYRGTYYNYHPKGALRTK